VFWRFFALVALPIVATASVVHWLTWNDSPSMPMGLYLRRALPVTVGSSVNFRVPAAAERLVAERGYFPLQNQLLKRVVAAAGDHVCLDGRDYRVNGRVLANVRQRDSAGRPLPLYRFCDVVPSGQVFVATDAPLSFDSRYFGPLLLRTLTVVTPLWTFLR
jgi:conjugative transfer signal peptidase TraF